MFVRSPGRLLVSPSRRSPRAEPRVPAGLLCPVSSGILLRDGEGRSRGVFQRGGNIWKTTLTQSCGGGGRWIMDTSLVRPSMVTGGTLYVYYCMTHISGPACLFPASFLPVSRLFPTCFPPVSHLFRGRRDRDAAVKDSR